MSLIMNIPGNIVQTALWGYYLETDPGQLPWQLESSYSSTSPTRQMPIGPALLLINDCVTAVFCLAGLVDE